MAPGKQYRTGTCTCTGTRTRTGATRHCNQLLRCATKLRDGVIVWDVCARAACIQSYGSGNGRAQSGTVVLAHGGTPAP